MSSNDMPVGGAIEPRASRRANILLRIAVVWAVAILGRLSFLQVVRHDEYTRLARQQHEVVVTVEPPRGAILDRNGLKLALSLPADSVYVNPMRLPDLGVAADILSKELNLDSRDLLYNLRMAVAANHGFLWIKRKITSEEFERLRSLKLEWIEFRRESRRYYPNRELAAHLLGAVDLDGTGIEGVEHSRNEELQGHSGAVRVSRDVRLRAFESAATEDAPEPGKDIRLTIDSRIQYIAERELKRAVIGHHCRTGSLVAMNPRNGDIVAMASYPSFDPNEPPQHGDDKTARFNLALSVPFEPGSVFKVITLSAALETTPLRPQSIIPCGNGSITLFGRTIHDHGRYASLPMEDVLARSSNIGAIQIGLKVGKENLHSYIKRFGFGSKTGLPLPGESAGIVRPPDHWEPSSIGSVAMGHEVSATTVQLARACAVIATGGLRVKPRLLADAPAEAPVRVLRAETAITMREMMEGVVIKAYGTGRRAKIPGYTAAGKTGTAQIADSETGRYTHFYNASFMGFAPVTNPAIVVVVTVNGATGLDGYGGAASAPVFREVAAAALRMMDVPKDLPDTLAENDSQGKIEDNDLSIADLGSHMSSPATPPPTALRPGESGPAALPSQFVAVAAVPPNLMARRRVPDFRGKTMRAVLMQTSELGLPVDFTGAGLARAQVPPAGSLLPPGERIQVQFGR